MKVAAVVFIGVVAVGGMLYLSTPGKPAVGASSPTPVVTPSPSASPGTPAPTLTPVPTPAGPMITARQIHTATLLADGRVLIAGGYDANDGTLASAELYDPKTATFTPTGSLATARGLHTATRLSDGRVLIAGGGPAGWVYFTASFFASAELYDPKTGTFSPTGSMATAREGHTATLLADGRVLIAGGTDTALHSVASAELYDPKTGTFTATGSMTTARGFHTATLLSDGRVLVAAGCAHGPGYSIGNFLASAEIYDPKAGTFAATGSMTDDRTYQGATPLADGRVLVTAGEGDNRVVAPLASAEIYNPKTGTFSPAGQGG